MSHPQWHPLPRACHVSPGRMMHPTSVLIQRCIRIDPSRLVPRGENVHASSTEQLRATIAAAGITESTDLVARILATGIGMGIDDTDRLDLKITSAALSEM